MFFYSWNVTDRLQAKVTAAYTHNPATLFLATPGFLSFPALAGATKQEGQGNVY